MMALRRRVCIDAIPCRCGAISANGRPIGRRTCCRGGRRRRTAMWRRRRGSARRSSGKRWTTTSGWSARRSRLVRYLACACPADTAPLRLVCRIRWQETSGEHRSLSSSAHSLQRYPVLPVLPLYYPGPPLFDTFGGALVSLDLSPITLVLTSHLYAAVATGWL